MCPKFKFVFFGWETFTSDLFLTILVEYISSRPQLSEQILRRRGKLPLKKTESTGKK